MFLIGVGLQIILALVNKWAAWHMYRGAGDSSYRDFANYKFWSWVNGKSWIDFWVDLTSLLALIYATYRVLTIFVVFQ